MSHQSNAKSSFDKQQVELNLRNLLVICSAITVFGLAFGMNVPLLSLTMESRGISTSMIGLNSSMLPIDVLLFSSVIPFLARRYSGKSTAIGAGVITCILILFYKLFDNLYA